VGCGKVNMVYCFAVGNNPHNGTFKSIENMWGSQFVSFMSFCLLVMLIAVVYGTTSLTFKYIGIFH
jgi:hypothetical protein